MDDQAPYGYKEKIGLTLEERDFVFTQDLTASNWGDLRGVTPATIRQLCQIAYRLHAEVHHRADALAAIKKAVTRIDPVALDQNVEALNLIEAEIKKVM